MLATLEDRLLGVLARRAAQRHGQAQWMRSRDPLTGLQNRPGFMQSVETLLQRGVSGSLAVIDLDHFKGVNDKHGHGAGDEVLCCVAARIQAGLTADVVASRYGGDEFVLFVPGPAEQARALLDRLMVAIRQPMPLGGATLCITVSAGLAPLRGDAASAEGARLRARLDRALSSADMAMYVAKSEGRDRWREFDDKIAGVATARRELALTVATLGERNRALEEQVELDALTGLRSRRALDGVLPSPCGGTDGSGRQFAVAFLDIDHFHDYNHHHGDHQGDEALRRVAQVIQAAARRGDMVYRKGGEEIVVVLPDATVEEARQAGERLRSAVERAGIVHRASATAPVMTVTVGVAASAPAQPLTTVQDLLVRAAQAAMQAKLRAERNQVHLG